MNAKKLIAQAKREYWENKVGFVYAPVVVALVFMSGLVALMLYGGVVNARGDLSATNEDFDCANLSCIGHLAKLANYIADTPEGFDNVVLHIMYGNAFLITATLALVLITYLHRCLFDDRKERDILFWRSMPVSEATNVWVKVGLIITALPLIVLIINLAFSILLILLGGLLFTVLGVAPSHLISSLASGGHFTVPFIVLYENVYWMLLLMPIIGYLLVASAYAKKSPFLTASLIPILVLLVDSLLDKYLGISLGFSHGLQQYFAVLLEARSAIVLGSLLEVNGSMLGKCLGSIAIGSVFVTIAIWLRNNRYEI
jgi:ABC-2 type transport system permease protein